jgi:hypothetical protein
MCWFILATVPSDGALAGLSPLRARFRLDFSPILNRYVLAQLGEGEILTRATLGHCDCGTDLASGNHRKVAAKAKAFRRAGWSEAKLARWIEQRSAAAMRSSSAVRGAEEQKTPSADAWVGFLHEALERISHIGLIVHATHVSGRGGHGDLAEQEFDIRAVERVPIRNVDAAFLDGMRRDVLYRFERDDG